MSITLGSRLTEALSVTQTGEEGRLESRASFQRLNLEVTHDTSCISQARSGHTARPNGERAASVGWEGEEGRRLVSPGDVPSPPPLSS